MTAAKTICPDCGAEFLQSTADSNAGRCLKCNPGNKRKESINHEDVAESLELSMRLLLGFVFSLLFASFGYGAGAVIWAGIGVILALICFPVGFVYGFFCREINSLIRGIFRAFLSYMS